MMRIMRENPVFVLAVIAFVVAVFVGSIFLVYGLKSGGGGGGLTEGTVVAVVEGVEIPYSEYLRNYNNQIDFYRQFYPGFGVSDLEERFGIRQKALDSMVNTRLLLAEAERMDLKVSDGELGRKIQQTPLFQEGGRFSVEKYRQLLAASRLAPAAYEESQRSEMLIEKVSNIVKDAVRVTEEEAWESFRRENEKVGLSLLPLRSSAYSGWISVDKTEVRDRYDENTEAYRRPERLRIAYLAIESSALEEILSPSSEELLRYYEENVDRWSRPRQIRARHVLIKVPEGVSPEREEELRQRAEYVLGKAGEGADFGELAREFSEDASGPEGGDLGWFGRGQMVPAFEEAAFALGPGEISDVVKSQFGYHVIKVEEEREAGTRPFDEVRDEVEGEYRRLEVRRLAAERAEEINDELYDGDFDEVAAAYGLTVQRADRLTKEDLLPGLGYRPEVTRELFSLEEGEVSEIFRQDGNYYIYKVEEKIQSRVPDFEEVKEEVESGLVAEKALVRAREEAEGMLAKLRAGMSLSAAAEMLKSEVAATEPFSRSGVVPAAGASGESFASAFALEEGDYGGPVTTDGSVWIFRVEEKLTSSQEDFESEKGELIRRLREEKTDLAFQSWLADLRRIRSVEVDESLLGITGE